MVVSEGVVLSQPSSTYSDGEDYHVDTASCSSSEDDHECDGAIVLRDDVTKEAPSFHNISVANSNDVHFGNRTFYQGPVTIKQFLYANKVPIDHGDDGDEVSAIKSGVVLNPTEAGNGLDNPVFVAEILQKNGSAGKPLAPETHSGVLKGFHRLREFSRKNLVLLVSLLAVLVVSLVILMVTLLVRHSPVLLPQEGPHRIPTDSNETDSNNTPIESPIDTTANLTLAPKLKLVSRLEWLAQPPVAAANALAVPVPYIIIHHTATENCSSQAQCVFHVRFIQTFHIESRNWWDIGYNFLVGGDGEAYEGRGWTSEGAHSYGYNSRSIGIAFIGTFNSIKPPQRQITACKQLIAMGVEKGFVKKDYKLLGARQLQTTQSPGSVLYEEIKTWDHWARAP